MATTAKQYSYTSASAWIQSTDISVAHSGTTLTISGTLNMYSGGSSLHSGTRYLWMNINGTNYYTGASVPLNVNSGTSYNSWMSFSYAFNLGSYDAGNVVVGFYVSGSSTSISTSGTLIWNGATSTSTSDCTLKTVSIGYNASYTACGAPSVVSCNIGIQIPNGGLTLSWSGAAAGTTNSIVGYDIYYSDDGSNFYYYNSVSTGNTYGSVTVYVSGTRAITRYWKVLTKGSAGGNYYSGLSSAYGYSKANSLPNAPSVSSNVSKVPNVGGSVTFTVTAGSDVDGQTRTIYYSTTSGGTKTVFTSPLVRTMTSGANVLYFWTYDGLEFSSSYTSKTISINTITTFSSITADYTAIDGTLEDANYPLSVVVNPTVNGVSNSDGDTLTYYWYFAQSDVIGDIPTSGTLWTTGSNATLGLTNISANITSGNFFRLGVRIYDGYDYSGDIVWMAYGFQRPNAPGSITLNNLFNSNTTANIADTNTTHFKDYITLQWTNPILGAGDANFTGLSLSYATSIDNATFGSYISIFNSSASYIASNTQYSYPWNGASLLSAATYVRFKLVLTTAEGISTTIYSTSFTCLKASLPNMPSSGVFDSIAEMHPIESSGNVAITFTSYEYFANATPSNYNLSDEEHNYKVFLILDGQSQAISIPQANWNSTTEDSVFNVAYSALVALATNLGKHNSNCTASFQVYVQDNFGNTGSVLNSASFVMDFRVRPTMDAVSTDNYGVQIMYSDTILGSIMYVTGNTPNNIMVNPGERIRFHFPAGSDLNGIADIVQYKIYVYRSDTLTFGTPSELLATKTVSSQTGVITYDHTVNINTTAAKFIKFAVQAVDSTGLVSEVKREFPQYLVGGRVTTPAATVSNAELDAEDLTITLSSIGLGGNTFVNPTYNYTTYPNLERTITGYTKQYSIDVEYCTDNLFDSGSGATVYGTDSQNFSGAYTTLLTGQNMIIASINSTIAQASRIYIRATLTIRTGLATDATSGTPTYVTTQVLTATLVFYNEVPTVSYRQNHVGINYRTFNVDDVLVISQTSTRNLIRFLGVLDTVDSEVILNLSNGVITGASMSAASITVDASNFTGNLSAADTTVQLALQTLDALVFSGGDVPDGGLTGQVLTKLSNSDGDVAWEEVIVPDVIDTLESDSTTDALSARMGKQLNDDKVDKAGGEISGTLNVVGGLSQGGNQVWHAGNDGTGSGLAADTVDGLHASSFLKNTASSAQVIGSPNVYDLPRIQAYGESASAGAAGVTFIRESAYAVNFGLDTDNALKVGGWSMGSQAHKIHHDGIMPYETGTWNPGLVANGSWTGATIASHSCRYVRIGKIVHLVGRLQISSKNGFSGGLLVSNFPFTCNNNASGSVGICGYTTAFETFSLHMDSGINFAYIMKNAQSMLNASEISDNFLLNAFQITYTIA